jgi:hypothetical protein
VVWTGRSCPAIPSKLEILVDVAPRARTNNLRFNFILLFPFNYEDPQEIAFGLYNFNFEIRFYGF